MPNPKQVQPEVSVIIVTYRSASHIVECLDSVCAQEGVSVEVIVVDNASNDSTAEKVRKYGSGVRLLANKENIGFGRACNQGVAASSGPLIYLLNPDAKPVGKDALLGLNQVMAAHPKWGMAALDRERPWQSFPSFSYRAGEGAKRFRPVAWADCLGPGREHGDPPRGLHRAKGF